MVYLGAVILFTFTLGGVMNERIWYVGFIAIVIGTLLAIGMMGWWE